jgi:hypothetical protein
MKIMTGSNLQKALIYIDSESVEHSFIPVRRENILKSLGVPPEKAENYLLDLIDELIVQCRQLSSPRAGCSIFSGVKFFPEQGMMSVNGLTFGLNRMVTSALLKSSEIAFFVGTCGTGLEQYSKKLLKEGHSLEGLIADIIGSEIAEGIADYIHSRLTDDMAEKGIGASNRYSPGYCNWPVSDQQSLFKIIGNNNCGIKLTDSSLMIPIKSISGIIGIGMSVENRGYACAVCESEYCLYRDKK